VNVVNTPPENGKGDASWDGLTDDEIFRRATMPRAIDGKVDWGIPPLTEEQPDEAITVRPRCVLPIEAGGWLVRIQAKVASFLEMKQDRGMHINTTLMSSTAFANPHIYAKLVSEEEEPMGAKTSTETACGQVEFVDIDERGSSFPGGGWLTRRGLEERVPSWGKAAVGEWCGNLRVRCVGWVVAWRAFWVRSRQRTYKSLQLRRWLHRRQLVFGPASPSRGRRAPTGTGTGRGRGRETERETETERESGVDDGRMEDGRTSGDDVY
jgi:hypothetical protein